MTYDASPAKKYVFLEGIVQSFFVLIVQFALWTKTVVQYMGFSGRSKVPILKKVQ
jgi:hypothetical protein